MKHSTLARILRITTAIVALAFAPILALSGQSTPAKNPAPETNSPPTNAAPAAATNPAPSHPSLTITTGDDDPDTAAGKEHAIKIEGHDDGSWDSEALLIPLAGIAGVFGMPVLVVLVVCYFKYRRRQEQLATVREFLAKGIAVPPQLLDDAAPLDEVTAPAAPGHGRDLRRGFKLAFIGLGVALALYFNDTHSTTWCWGLIPLVMGVGYILSGLIEKLERPKGSSPVTPPGPRQP